MSVTVTRAAASRTAAPAVVLPCPPPPRLCSGTRRRGAAGPLCRMPSASPRTSVAAGRRRAPGGLPPGAPPPTMERESDQHRLAQRQKQVGVPHACCLRRLPCRLVHGLHSHCSIPAHWSLSCLPLHQLTLQVDLGKNTLGYQRYRAAVPRCAHLWLHSALLLRMLGATGC